MSLKIQPQAIFKNHPQTLLKIKPQLLVKTDPQTLLKIDTQLWLKKRSTNVTQKLIHKSLKKNRPTSIT